MNQRNQIRNLTVAAMLSAVAFVLMFLDFSLPMFIPSFVKMDFSDLPALLGSFALGPVYGIVISLVKNLLHLIIPGTSTAGVGEVCNFLLGGHLRLCSGLYLPAEQDPQDRYPGRGGGRRGHGHPQRAGELLHHLPRLRQVL